MVVLDGLHRRAGLETALKRDSSLGEESVAIVLYVDPAFERSEQAISDLRRHESRFSRSQGLLCDQRDETARLARDLVNQVEVFSDMTEMAKSKISNRSLKLFTLSAIYHATKTLLSGMHKAPYADRLTTATTFWNEVAKQIPDWHRAKERQVSPAELRRNFVHAHGIALAALGRVGKDLVANHPRDWKSRLRSLRTMNWSRSNSRLWEGRAMVAGRLSKTSVSVILTANAIKRHLGVPLSRDEEQVERQSGRRLEQ